MPPARRPASRPRSGAATTGFAGSILERCLLPADALYQEVAELPPSFSEPQVQPIYAMGRVDPASGALRILRAPEPNLYVASLWDPAGSGAVVRVLGADGRTTLRWLPVGAGPPTALSMQLDSAGLWWAVR